MIAKIEKKNQISFCFYSFHPCTLSLLVVTSLHNKQMINTEKLEVKRKGKQEKINEEVIKNQKEEKKVKRKDHQKKRKMIDIQCI